MFLEERMKMLEKSDNNKYNTRMNSERLGIKRTLRIIETKYSAAEPKEKPNSSEKDNN